MSRPYQKMRTGFPTSMGKVAVKTCPKMFCETGSSAAGVGRLRKRPGDPCMGMGSGRARATCGPQRLATLSGTSKLKCFSSQKELDLKPVCG